jgi:hypothetical protein
MRGAILVLLLLPVAACATAKAKAPEVRVPLEVPPPPPRVIEPLPSTEPASLEPVAELPPSTTTTTPRPRPAPQKEPNRTEPPKPENKPEATVDPTTPAPPPPTTAPVPPLRTPGSAEGEAANRQVKDTLDRAKKMLDSIDARGLNGDRLANYNGAKAFMQQSEDALKAANYILAKSLAERAEKIAVQLLGR